MKKLLLAALLVTGGLQAADGGEDGRRPGTPPAGRPGAGMDQLAALQALLAAQQGGAAGADVQDLAELIAALAVAGAAVDRHVADGQGPLGVLEIVRVSVAAGPCGRADCTRCGAAAGGTTGSLEGQETESAGGAADSDSDGDSSDSGE